MSQKNRSVRNTLESASMAKKYHLHVSAVGVVLLTGFLFYGYFQLTQLHAMAESLADPLLASQFQGRLLKLTILTFLGFLVFISVNIFSMTLLGSRVGGASVAIIAFIRELKQGQYDSNRELRPNDELSGIMVELKSLAEVLKSKAKN